MKVNRLTNESADAAENNWSYLFLSQRNNNQADHAAEHQDETKNKLGLSICWLGREEKTGEPLILGINNNTLAIAGGGPLIPLAADRFRNRSTLMFMSEAELELQFLSADLIEIKTADGIVTRYRRAKPYTPAADDLNELAGRFYSDELLATFDVTPGKGGLLVRANQANTVEFKPVERDTFQIGRMLLRFTRDKAGKVVGLEYSNPLLRKVKFVRTDTR